MCYSTEIGGAAAHYTVDGDWPDTAFYLGDFSNVPLPQTDYVLASGAMGYRTSDPLFALQTITRLFGVCRLGFGFNMLRRVEYAGGILAAHDPDTVLAHCRSLTPHVSFREGYLDDDFTVVMYRSRKEQEPAALV